VPLHLTLENVDYGVIDTMMPQAGPDGEQAPPLPMKLLRFVDPQSGIIVDVPLPSAKPFGVEVPPDFTPPAYDLGKKLLDNKPQVEVARVMPPPQPPPMAGRGRPHR
jgi:hypothetical protein